MQFISFLLLIGGFSYNVVFSSQCNLFFHKKNENSDEVGKSLDERTLSLLKKRKHHKLEEKYQENWYEADNSDLLKKVPTAKSKRQSDPNKNNLKESKNELNPTQNNDNPKKKDNKTHETRKKYQKNFYHADNSDSNSDSNSDLLKKVPTEKSKNELNQILNDSDNDIKMAESIIMTRDGVRRLFKQESSSLFLEKVPTVKSKNKKPNKNNLNNKNNPKIGMAESIMMTSDDVREFLKNNDPNNQRQDNNNQPIEQVSSRLLLEKVPTVESKKKINNYDDIEMMKETL